MSIFYLSEENVFPSPNFASQAGLVAVGGDLSAERLLLAYHMGIFPWYNEQEPILWWSPDPRLVLYPGEIRISRTLKKILKKQVFSITIDMAFEEVINLCAKVRVENNEKTWISSDMIKSYCRLHKMGFAHSVEAWYNGELVGGFYGVSLGRCFCGESMFTLISNASKAALAVFVKYLEKMSFDFIDCQVATDHLKRFGAREIPRYVYLKQLEKTLKMPSLCGKWNYLQ